MLKKTLMALALVGAAASAQAATITCLSDSDERYVTITYNDSSSTMTCGPAGSTNDGAEGSVLTVDPYNYNFLEKDDGESDNENGGLLSISGLAGTSGSFSVDLSVADGILVFKFGSGGDEPDWIAFNLNGVTSGDWVVTGQQSLSHATLYGSKSDVPVPGTLGLLGLGFAGLGLVRRKQKA